MAPRLRALGVAAAAMLVGPAAAQAAADWTLAFAAPPLRGAQRGPSLRGDAGVHSLRAGAAAPAGPEAGAAAGRGAPLAAAAAALAAAVAAVAARAAARGAARRRGAVARLATGKKSKYNFDYKNHTWRFYEQYKNEADISREKVQTDPTQAIPWWERMDRQRMEHGMGLLCEKTDTTQVFEGPYGKMMTATILTIKRGGNVVVNKKWPERDGYYAVAVGYDRIKEVGPWDKRVSYFEQLELSGIPPVHRTKEFRVRPQEWKKWEIGQRLTPSMLFKEGDLLDVHSISQGTGKISVIKRWGHKRGPMTHGSKNHRRRGSVGSGAATPSHVLPGCRQPGWHGMRPSLDQNLRILKIIDGIDEDNMPESIIIVKGSVAGYKAHWKEGGSYVWIHPSANKFADGRMKRDPVYMWGIEKKDGVNPFIPMERQWWAWKTYFGRDIRWYKHEEKKYWPHGRPGRDISRDPFYDECDPIRAIKAPEW